MKPGGPSSASISSGRLAEAGAERVGELDLVEAVVAADQGQQHPPSLDDDGHRLQRRARRDPERLGHRVDGGQSGRRNLARCVQRRRQLDRLGGRRGDLDVGGVPGRKRDLVLAGRARGHVLVGAGAAHHPDVGLDLIPAQLAAVEYPRVGLAVELVVRVEAVLVAVERVRVLHRELAGAQDPGTRARLVALLDLDVVEDLRQLA